MIDVVELVSEPSEESTSVSFAASSSTWSAGATIGSVVVLIVP